MNFLILKIIISINIEFIGRVSGICKFELLKDWLEVFYSLKNVAGLSGIISKQLSGINNLSYIDLKKLAIDYQECKSHVNFYF